MKALVLSVLALVMVGCASSNRCHTCTNNKPVAKAKQIDKQHRNFDRPGHRRGETMHAQERFETAVRKIRQSVADGELTKEEAREKVEALRKRMGEVDRGQRKRNNKKN